MRVSSLPKTVTWKRTSRDSNPRPLQSRENALPLSHRGHWVYKEYNDINSSMTHCSLLHRTSLDSYWRHRRATSEVRRALYCDTGNVLHGMLHRQTKHSQIEYRDKSINQLIDRLIDRLIDQSINQSVNRDFNASWQTATRRLSFCFSIIATSFLVNKGEYIQSKKRV